MTIIELAGECMELLPEGAIHWQRHRRLIVADTHFGRADALRARGLAIPPGTTARDLQRLGALLDRTGAQRLTVLGDFVECPPRGDADWLRRFRAWRATRPGIGIDVIPGNHDRDWRPPADSHIDWQPPVVLEPPFVLTHEPVSHPAGHVLAGHWHPGVVLRDRGDHLRLPCFEVTDTHTVLPAFGGLTGLAERRPDPRRRLFIAGGGRVRAVPRGDRA